MNEKLDAILSEYEEIWRGAALSGRAQAFGTGRGGDGLCAVLVAPLPLRAAIDAVHLGWICHEPECGRLRMQYPGTAGGAARHLNDTHRWTWDMFANKFRDALEQGTAK